MSRIYNQPNQIHVLMVLMTLCVSFFTWGTITVLRTVTDVNYREPTKIEKYKDCMDSYGDVKSEDCKVLVK